MDEEEEELLVHVAYQTCTGPAGVREYLTRRGIADEQVDLAFEKAENMIEIARAATLASMNYYPGDKIADREGWTLADDDDDDGYEQDE